MFPVSLCSIGRRLSISINCCRRISRDSSALDCCCRRCSTRFSRIDISLRTLSRSGKSISTVTDQLNKYRFWSYSRWKEKRTLRRKLSGRLCPTNYTLLPLSGSFKHIRINTLFLARRRITYKIGKNRGFDRFFL